MYTNLQSPLSTCKKLSLLEKLILSDVISFYETYRASGEETQYNGHTVKSNEFYAWQYGVGRATVQRAVNKLTDLNLISKSSQLTKKGGIRTLHPNMTNINSYVSENAVAEPESREFTFFVNTNTENKAKSEESSNEASKHAKAQNEPDPRLKMSLAKAQNESVKYSSKIQLETTVSKPQLASKVEGESFNQKVFAEEIKKTHPRCNEAMAILKDFKINEGMNNIYLGSLSMEDWDNCEANLAEATDTAEDVEIVLWNIYQKKCQNKETVSLPFILHTHIMTETEFCAAAQEFIA